MNTTSKLAAFFVVPLITGLLGACSPGALRGYDDDSPFRDGFRLVNTTPFTTTVGGDNLIDVWVTSTAAADYAKVKLDGSGSGVNLPEGTVIVREVIGASGEVEKLTMMIKGAPGYFPGGGDWWYGVADPQGRILPDGDGGLQMGTLEQCGSCHLTRASDGYLFGVPSDVSPYHQ